MCKTIELYLVEKCVTREIFFQNDIHWGAILLIKEMQCIEETLRPLEVKSICFCGERKLISSAQCLHVNRSSGNSSKTFSYAFSFAILFVGHIMKLKMMRLRKGLCKFCEIQ